jgi:hypothetical protein
MDEFTLPRLTYVGFLFLIVTALLSGIHQAVAQVPASTPVRTVDPVDPVQIEKNVPFLTNQRAANNVVMITVPDKKRLVIEYVSVNAIFPTGQDVTSAFITTTAGQIQTTGLPPTFQHFITTSPRKPLDPANDITNFGQSVRIYADKNTDVVVGMTRNPGTGAAPNVFLTISGYFVPQP